MDHPISAPAFGLSKAGSERKPSVGRESHKISKINIEDTEDPSPIKSDNFYQNNHENNSFLNISPSDEASSYQISNSVIITYSILIIAVCAVGFVLQYLQEVLVPFVVAVFLYYLIKPLVAFMTRPFKIYWFSILIPDGIDSAYEGISNDSSYDGLLEGRRHSRSSSHHTRNPDAEYIAEAMSHTRSEETPLVRANLPWYHMELVSIRLPRVLGILFAILVILALCTAVAVFIVSSIDEFQTQELAKYKEEATHLIKEVTVWLKTMFNLDISQLIDYIVSMIPLSTILSNAVIYIYTFACDLFWDDSSNQHTGPKYRKKPATMTDKINEQIERYIVVKTLISLLVGILVYLILGPVLNVKLSGIWGVLTFFLNYIPNVGPFLAIFVSLPIIILDASLSFISKSLAVLVPFLIHAIIGNVVEPKAFGSSLELHPIVVLLCLSIWYVLWGVPGAILSVPITAVIRIVLTTLDYPIATIMARLLEGHLWGTNEAPRQASYYYSGPYRDGCGGVVFLFRRQYESLE